MPFASGIATRLTFAGGIYPKWSPDGKHVYYANASIYKRAADGELLFRAPSRGVLSRDGKRFLVQVPEGGDQPNLPMVVVEHWAAGLGK